MLRRPRRVQFPTRIRTSRLGGNGVGVERGKRLAEDHKQEFG
jgi:hypothetical protein